MNLLSILIILAAPQAGDDSPPTTGEDWLRKCEAKNSCTAGVMGFYHGLVFGGDKTVCPKGSPNQVADFEPMTRAVTQHLRDHPEVRSQKTFAALLAALRATSPCPAR